MSESPLFFDAEIADHQVILRAGRVEAVVVSLEEYQALKALEQRDAELYWDAQAVYEEPGFGPRSCTRPAWWYSALPRASVACAASS